MTHRQIDTQHRHRRWTTIVSTASLCIVLTLFALITVVQFAAAGRDDTYLMLWSGKTFTFADWFINYNGKSEELSSSMIAPWIAAIGYRVAPQTPLLFFKSVSLAASLCSLCLIWWQRKRLLPEQLPEILVPSVVFAVAMSPMFEYWTLGGLETPFQSLLFLLAPLTQVKFHEKRTATNGLLLAAALTLLSLVRTEGFIYIACSFAFLVVVRDRRNLIRDLSPILASLLVTAALLFVRVRFTGAMWPNPTYAKVDGLFNQLGNGYEYLSSYYLTGGPAAWLQGAATVYAISCLFYYCFFRRRDIGLVTADLIVIMLSSYIALHELFVVFAGGSWMEYYRFLVPTIPLKVLLLAHLIALAVNRFTRDQRAAAFALSGALLLVCGASAYQQTYSTEINCAASMSDVPFRQRSLIAIEEELIGHNCALGRDRLAILPFIRNELPKYVERVQQVRIATYQAGYFPYHIREHFSARDVVFIDTFGLATRDIAQVKARRTQLGIADASELDRILAGNAGELSDVLLAFDPNMLYLLRASPDSRENMKRLGYVVVWDEPNAVVFFKETASNPPLRSDEGQLRQSRADPQR